MAFDWDSLPYDDKVAQVPATADEYIYRGRAADFNWIKAALEKLRSLVNGDAGTIDSAAIPDLSGVYALAADVTSALAGMETSAHAASTYETQTHAAATYAAKTQPVLLSAFYPGKPGASAIVLAFLPTVAVTIPAGLTGSRAKAGTNPTATATLSVQKNGVEVGTIAIATNGAVTLAAASSISLTTTDELTVVAPGSQDATLADVRITLHGTR